MKLSAMIKVAFNGCGRSVTSSTFSTKDGYLPGGTAMIARGRVIGRCQRSGKDDLGCFTWMTLRSRDGIGILVITTYRFGQVKGTKAGPNTAYMQQWVEMRNRGELSPDLRNSILHDITILINEWAKQGYHPLIMIDVNATSEEKGLEAFIEQHGLFDLIAEVNEGPPPSTYARG